MIFRCSLLNRDVMSRSASVAHVRHRRCFRLWDSKTEIPAQMCSFIQKEESDVITLSHRNSRRCSRYPDRMDGRVSTGRRFFHRHVEDQPGEIDIQSRSAAQEL